MFDFTRSKYPHHLAQDGDDWLIRYRGGRPLARVTLDQRVDPPRWSRAIWTEPGSKGTAASLEDALAAVKGFVLTLPPEKRVKPMTPGDKYRRDNPKLGRAR